MFSKLVGNEPVKTTLRQLISKGRVPNSLLFVGGEGVGKRRFALQLAKTFVCTDPTNGEACDVCSACRRAEILTLPKPEDKDSFKRVLFTDHPDIGYVIPYNRNILVDAVRHLESEANFRPYESASRFFIIDDVHKMNDAAANALLKTLEEPPATSNIFLVTSRPDALLPTIRSRCQMLRFAPVQTDDIQQFLINDRAFTSDEARLAASLSRGSIGGAVSIDIEKFRGRRDRMLTVAANAIETGDVAALLRISEEMNDAKNKETFEESIDILSSILHDIWTVRISRDVSRLVNTDLADRVGELAGNPSASNIPAWLSAIDTMRQNLIVNINRKVATDALFAGMAT